MKELLAALAAFGADPEKVGDNLFSFFASITAMNWEQAVAAGCAIHTLYTDAYNRANVGKASDDYSALSDPKYTRLKSCLAPAVARVGQLLAQAPKEEWAMLIDSVTGRHGFVDSNTANRWRKTLGIAVEK